jgi:hypothetical protein
MEVAGRHGLPQATQAEARRMKTKRLNKRRVLIPEWRVVRTHAFLVSIHQGRGVRSGMVADVLSPVDAEHIVNLHNTYRKLKLT